MDLGRLAARSLIAAVAGWTAAAGLAGGATAHACCLEIEGSYFAVERPRNTLVMVRGGDYVPSLRRVATMGAPGPQRRSESIPLAALGVGDLWRPERLLEVGAEYEVVVGPDVWSGFVVERDVDVSPPDFAGVTAATFRRHDWATTVEVTHHPLPLDVAFIVVRLRRRGPGGIGSPQMLGIRRGVTSHRRELTVLSSTCDFPNAPPIEVGATYCVSIVAHDAAGNASRGDVEVCSPVIEFPPGPEEIGLKDVTLPCWASARARLAASILALLVLCAAWRWHRRRRALVRRWA